MCVCLTGKKFEKRLTFGDVTDRSIVSCFLDSQRSSLFLHYVVLKSLIYVSYEPTDAVFL